MKNEATNQKKQYYGLLGLDRLPWSVKVMNFIVSIPVGIYLAFDSWFSHFYRGFPFYIAPPFLSLIFAWPLCGILLWLRLTGIRWVWCFVAAVMILLGYYMLQIIALAIGEFIS